MSPKNSLFPGGFPRLATTLLATLCFLLPCFTSVLFAQSTALPVTGTAYHPSPSERQALSEKFTDFQVFNLDQNALNNFPDAAELTLSFQLGQGLTGTAHLEKNDLRSPQYRATETNEKGTIDLPSGRIYTYKGHLNGTHSSEVRLSLYPGAISGYFRADSTLRFLEPLHNLIPGAPAHTYLTYTNRDIIPTGETFCLGEQVHEKAKSFSPNLPPVNPLPHSHPKHFNSGSQHHPNPPSPSSSKTGSGPSGSPNPPASPLLPGQVTTNCYFLEIAVEEDYEWYLDFGGSVPAANAQAMNILNQVEGLYCGDFDMVFQVTLQNIHTLPADPYTSTTLLARLIEFRSVWNTTPPFNTTPRDVAHMFTGTNFGGGPVGYAYVGVICRTAAAYGVTQNYSSGLYGQLVICAHEIGHNFTGAHGDGASCGSLGSVMCPFVQPNSFYFSAATQSRFNTYMSGLSCLAPDLAITPPTATLCTGPSTTFSVPFDPDWTYQWYRDSVLISGATSDSYTASIPGTYIVDILNYDTTCTTCNVSLCAELVSGNMVVTNTNDAGGGSLRQALINANACPGWDTITFDIPGAGPHTIIPLSGLPAATDTVFIDGYSQPGAAKATATTPATLMIELSGSSAGNAMGLQFDTDFCEVEGLCINSFSGFGTTGGSGVFVNGATNVKVMGNYLGTDLNGTMDLGNASAGVYVSAGSHDLTVGTSAPEDFNLISGNNSAGISLFGTGDTIRNPVIQGNYIGTDLTGTLPVPNRDGIYCYFVKGALVGGGNPGEGNVISGNTQNGINFNYIVYDSEIYGNLVGTDASGTLPLGNGGAPNAFPWYAGINVNGQNITIGYNLPGWGNVISNNTMGIKMQYNDPRQGSPPPVENIYVWNNKIGTDINGINPMGNQASGIQVNYYGGGVGMFTNIIGGAAAGFENVIANNGQLTLSTNGYDHAGVAFIAQGVFGTSGGGSLARGNTKVFRNTIRNNFGKGIYIDSLAMDFPEEWKTPILTSVVRDCPTHTTTINGNLVNNSPNRQYRIEFFANFAPDVTGGEGEFYIGFTNVTTDGSGNASFSVPYNATRIPSGACISATATSQPTGNTSEFSNNMCVTLDPLVLSPYPDQTVCEGNPLSMLAWYPTDSVTWIVPSQGYIPNDTLSYTPTVDETVILMVIDTCGRVGFDTVDVTVNPLLDPNLGQDTAICRGDTITLDAGGGGVMYEWHDGTSTQTFEASGNGVYFVRVFDGNFCMALDSITVVTIGPNADLGPDTLFCPDGLLDPGYEEGATYLWNTGGTDQFLTVNTAGQYHVTVTDTNGCVDRDTIDIGLDTVVVDLGADTVYVSGDSLDAGHPGCSYLWNTGETTRVIYPGAPGNYTVQVICPGGCGNIDDINLTTTGLAAEALLLDARLNEWQWVDLNWICEASDCAGEFVLERAGEDLDFVALESGRVPVTGKQSYVDAVPLEGLNHYRVRIVRGDGSELVSNLERVVLEPEERLLIYPVPAEEEVFVEWVFERGDGFVGEITDALGRVVWKEQVEGASGRLIISCDDWAAGMYVVSVKSGGRNYIRKLVVR